LRRCWQIGYVIMWAVVPLKSPDVAKSRLSGALDAAGRRALFFGMARQVLGALLDTPSLEYVAVVTASAEVAGFAQSLGASVIWEEREAGTAAACRAAVAAASGRTDSLLMLSGDLPLASAAALEPLVSFAGPSRRVAIVADRRRVGTNALLCAPADVIPICFGPDSFQRHVAACGPEVALEIVESSALSLDIDDEQDLRELRRRLPTGTVPALRELSGVLAAGSQLLTQ
jgi:2-phospho-L-lactate/phosphoenolpyruvate guanylyltransferase